MLDPLERKILDVVGRAFSRPVAGGHNLCDVPEALLPVLSQAERSKLEQALERLVERGWLMRQADSYYAPTAAGERARAEASRR